MKFVWVVVFLFASTCAALADVGPPMAETLRRSADGGRISVRDARAIASGAEPYHRVFIHMKDDAPGGDGAGRQAGAPAVAAQKARVLARHFGGAVKAEDDYGLLTFRSGGLLSATVSAGEVEGLLRDPDVSFVAIVPRGTFAVRPAVAPPPPSGVNKDQVLVAAQKLLGVDKLAKAGLTGAGYSIVMIDGGVDLTVRAMKRAVVDGFCFSRTDKKLGMTSSCPAGVKFGARSLAAGSQTCAFAGCEHGTMVASVIVGSDTASEYRGFARDVKIISINTLRKLAKPDKDGNLYAIYFDDVLAAIERVNAEVMTPKKKALKYRIGALNISLGMECSGFRFAYGADEIYNMRRSRSVATVAAAGNGGSFDDDDAKSDWPACATYAERVGEVAMDYTLGENPITNRADRYAVSEGLPVMAASVGQGRYAMERRRGTSLAAPQLSAAHVLGLQAGTIGLLAAPKIPIALGKRAPGVGAEGVGYVPRVDAAAASLRRFDTFVPAVPKFDYFNWTTNRPEIAAACIDEEKYDRNIANNTFYKFRTSGCQSSKIFTFYGPSFSGKKNKLKIKGVGMIRDEVIDGASNGEWFTAGRERDNETVWNWPYPFFNTEAVIVNAEGGVVERLSVNVAKKVVRCSGPAESTKDESSTCKCVSGCEYDVDYK